MNKDSLLDKDGGQNIPNEVLAADDWTKQDKSKADISKKNSLDATVSDCFSVKSVPDKTNGNILVSLWSLGYTCATVSQCGRGEQSRGRRSPLLMACLHSLLLARQLPN